MISFLHPQPLQGAIDSVSVRTPLGTALRTEEISRLPAEIRQRAFFSAAVEEMRLLERMKRDILTRLRLERRTLADGTQGTFQRRDQFLSEMQALAESYGLRPTDGSRGSLQDIGSFRRLRLIWDVQTKMAQGYSRHLTEHTEVGIDRAPAYELIRKEAREMPRDWPTRWRDAMLDLGEDTRAIITPTGRMMAPKGDIIWTYISRFDQPWEPFDFNSGMGLRSVRRAVAEKLGVITPGEKISVETGNFNTGLEASLNGISTPSREKLKDYFGDTVDVDDEAGVIKWRGDRVDAIIENSETAAPVSMGVASGGILSKAAETGADISDHRLIIGGDSALAGIGFSTIWELLTGWRRPASVTPGELPGTLNVSYNIFGQIIDLVLSRETAEKVLKITAVAALLKGGGV